MIDVLLIGFVLLGHAVLWVGLANRLHATSVPQWLNRSGSYLSHAPLMLIPPLAAIWLLTAASTADRAHGILFARGLWPLIYYIPCWLLAAWQIPRWLAWRLSNKPAAALVANHTTVVDVQQRLGKPLTGNWQGALVARIPGNEVFQIHVQEKTLALPRLRPSANGLSIAHVSDWHLTGRVSRAYYEEVVRLTNELDADFIAVTGDLLDRASCYDWIPDTMARLHARHGVFFVLGNHDVRYGWHDRLRDTLTAAGWFDLGRNTWRGEIRGQDILLAGNERPWFRNGKPSPFRWRRQSQSDAIDSSRDGRRKDSPPTDDPSTLRILLSHSPDQFAWAKRNSFDLMLAGHTHGGQVRLPWIGAVYVPSHFGARYACGLFDEPPTLLHVTRGIGGDVPWRWNCPPEIAKLVLTAPLSATR